MAPPSTSSGSTVSDEELVRDAALCLRSFYGCRDVIPYSKFCERFKKNFGYSIKDQLKKSDSTFADIMERISMTTRTKCEYDAEQKMITLMSEKMNNFDVQENVPHLILPIAVAVPIIQPTPLFVPLHPFNPRTPAFVPPPQAFTFPKAPLIPSPEPPMFAAAAHGFHQINPQMSSVTSIQPTPIDDRVNSDGSSRVEIVEENSDMNEASQSLTAIPWSTCDALDPQFEQSSNQDAVVDENYGMASASQAVIPWTTCDGLEPQHEESSNLDAIADENYDMTYASQSQVAIPWSTCDCLEPQYQRNFNQDAAFESTTGNCEPEMDKHVPLEGTRDEYFGESDDSYYDAEEELNPENSSLPHDDQDFPWSQYELNSTVEYDEYIGSQAISSVIEATTPKEFTPQSTYTTVARSSERTTNHSDLADDIELDEHQRESLRELSALRAMGSSLPSLEPQAHSLLENTTQQREDTTDRMQDSPSVQRDAELSAARRGSSGSDHAAMDEPGTSRQDQDVEELTQKMMRTISLRDKLFNANVDDKKLRIDAKEECLRLWGNKVNNLGELLCFLKLYHMVNGPLLIDECEQRIEAYVRKPGVVGDLSWARFGETMSVKRMFELKMFRALEPPNRQKVQPVDCILNARFRILPKGLLSEVYRMLVNVDLTTIDVISQQSQLSFAETGEEARKEELRAALQSEPDVFLLREGHVKLADNEDCFIVTGVSEC